MFLLAAHAAEYWKLKRKDSFFCTLVLLKTVTGLFIRERDKEQMCRHFRKLDDFLLYKATIYRHRASNECLEKVILYYDAIDLNGESEDPVTTASMTSRALWKRCSSESAILC